MILGFGLAKNETGALTLVTCSLRGVGLKEVSVTCFNIMCSLIFFFPLIAGYVQISEILLQFFLES